MKETSLALQTEQTTKGGSCPDAAVHFGFGNGFCLLGIGCQVFVRKARRQRQIPNPRFLIPTWQRFSDRRSFSVFVSNVASTKARICSSAVCGHTSHTKSNELLRTHRREPLPAATACESDLAMLDARLPLWKRIIDLGILACTVWIWLPLAMLVLCVVKLASPGPAIYRQGRVGYRGRHFMIFKFRTMRVNAETRTHEQYLEQLMSSDSPMTKLDASDSRVVPVGRFLRATGLDELPQIFNIIRGEMSLVGPRPCTAVEFQRYCPEQRDRVNAFPGVTGLWQVNGKNKTTFNEMIAMDIHYARNMSLGLDLWIIAKTLPAIVSQCHQSLTARRRRPATLPGSCFPGNMKATDRNPRHPLRIGVVGCGYWGPLLIRNFHGLPDCRVTAICDAREDRLQHLCSLYPGLEGVTDFEKFLHSVELDAVVIATPVKLHHSLAKASLLAGKHTFIEKPMAASSAECEELIEIAKRNGLVLMVDHTFLYSAAIEKIKHIVQDGDLGEIRYINSRRLNLGLFQRDINVAWDLAPHDISIILHILGESPSSINCQGNAHVTPQIEDVTNISLSFGQERFATIQSSWLEPRKVRDMTIVGTQRMIVYDDLEPREKIQIYDVRVELLPHYDSFAEFQYAYHYGDSFIPHINQTEPLQAVCEHFLDCVENHHEPLSGGREGLELVRILEAASLSLKSSGAPIDLVPLRQRAASAPVPNGRDRRRSIVANQ